MTTKKWIGFLIGLAVTIALAAPAFAWVNDSEVPGSVLVFPKFVRGTDNDLGVSGQVVHALTELELSVVCPPGEFCSKDTKVRLRAHWVCPGCGESSFNLETTVGGTLYFNPEGVTVIGGVVVANVFPNNAKTVIPVPPCPKGYLIVWVVDRYGKAIKFDGLIGDAVIREPIFTLGPTTARAHNAFPIQASDWKATGDPTDADGDGNLDFDGSEYRPITGKIFGTVRYENSVPPEGTVETTLTLLTLDVASDRANPPTRVGLNFYTPDEGLVDTATSFTCWTEVHLTAILPSLTKQTMGRKGVVESTYAEQQPDLWTTKPVTLLGIVETQERYVLTGTAEPGRSYAYWLYNDSNPVDTTFKP